jgi:SOS-response transcriptional repressor LexA
LNLKSLVHRELGEGLTESELASGAGVPVRTIRNILSDKLPRDRSIWEKFARYFRMDVDFLRDGQPSHAPTVVELSGSVGRSAAGQIRKVPLLHWHQIDQMLKTESVPSVIHADALIEATEVSGQRTFALKVQDDSMEPLFSTGEMIFVNPDLDWQPGDYVIARHLEGDSETRLLRQVKRIGKQCMLHPLNRKYDDLPLTNQGAVWGKVVRLRKNL